MSRTEGGRQPATHAWQNSENCNKIKFILYNFDFIDNEASPGAGATTVRSRGGGDLYRPERIAVTASARLDAVRSCEQDGSEREHGRQPGKRTPIGGVR